MGVDVGATKVRAVSVLSGRGGRYEVVRRSGRLAYPDAPDFRPVGLSFQLEDRDRGRVRLSETERRRGAQIIATVARAVCRVTSPEFEARVGLCVAGLKDSRGAGVLVCANGPRMPQFSDDLKEQLDRLHRPRVRPCIPLSSDGFCCGLAEDAWQRGRFRTVDNAYYAGAGTGLAEAVKMDGAVLSMDEVSDWFPKAWQLTSGSGKPAEASVSASGLVRTYARAIGHPGGASSSTLRPLTAAARGDVAAREALLQWAHDWAGFLMRRVMLWNRGAAGNLQRVVLGQRAGSALAEPALRAFFRGPLEHELVGMLGGRAGLAADYLVSGRLRAGFLMASRWMEAPAVGAAILVGRETTTE